MDVSWYMKLSGEEGGTGLGVIVKLNTYWKFRCPFCAFQD